MRRAMTENLAFVRSWDRHRPSKMGSPRRGKPLSLTSNQFRLLHFLASNAGKSVLDKRIIEAVHGPDYAVTERSVDVQMVELRKNWGISDADPNRAWRWISIPGIERGG